MKKYNYYIGFYVDQIYSYYKSGKKKGQQRPLDLEKDQKLRYFLIKADENCWLETTKTTYFRNNEKFDIESLLYVFTKDHILKTDGDIDKFFNDISFKDSHLWPKYIKINTNKYGFIHAQFESDEEAIAWYEEEKSSGRYK